MDMTISIQSAVTIQLQEFGQRKHACTIPDAMSAAACWVSGKKCDRYSDPKAEIDLNLSLDLMLQMGITMPSGVIMAVAGWHQLRSTLQALTNGKLWPL